MSGLNEGGKALVRAGRQADRPSEADRQRISEALRARLGDAALLTSGIAAIPPARSGTLLPRSKFINWGSWLGSTALLAGSLWLLPRVTQRRDGATLVPSTSPTRAGSVPGIPATALAPSPLSESAPSSPPSSTLPDLRVAAAAGVGRQNDRGQTAASARDGLGDEVALLSRAETELHAGRPASALLALAEHQRKFPRGALAEERTAARIQALCALGRNAEANAQLRQLLHISPKSALEARTRQACRSAP